MIVTIVFHRFAGDTLTKGRLFVMDCFKWAPKGAFLWLLDWGKGPQMIKLRQNRTYAHEVASKLIEEKRQELKDGTSRKDILSLLGPSFIFFAHHSRW